MSERRSANVIQSMSFVNLVCLSVKASQEES